MFSLADIAGFSKHNMTAWDFRHLVGKRKHITAKKHSGELYNGFNKEVVWHQ